MLKTISIAVLALVVAFTGYLLFFHHPVHLALASVDTPLSPKETTVYEKVMRVHDTDTFVIDAKWNPYPKVIYSVRLVGIDAPEKGTKAKCLYERNLEAQGENFVKKLLADSGNQVRLIDVKSDKFGGRLDARVVLADGKILNDEVLKAGFARQYNGSGPRPNWCKG